MYIILHYQSENDNYVDAIRCKDGQIKLFETLKEADATANQHPKSDDLVVISAEAEFGNSNY